MASIKDNQRIDPASYLGLDYHSYKNELYAKALSQPSEYFKMRKVVEQSAKKDAIGDMYNTLYNLLSKGQSKDGTSLITGVDGGVIEPGYPTQEISEFALSAAKTLNKILDEALEIIMPIEYKTLVSKRMEEQSEQKIR